MPMPGYTAGGIRSIIYRVYYKLIPLWITPPAPLKHTPGGGMPLHQLKLPKQASELRANMQWENREKKGGVGEGHIHNKRNKGGGLRYMCINNKEILDRL